MSKGLLLFLALMFFVMGLWTSVEFIVSLFNPGEQNRMSIFIELTFWFYLFWFHIRMTLLQVENESLKETE